MADADELFNLKVTASAPATLVHTSHGTFLTEDGTTFRRLGRDTGVPPMLMKSICKQLQSQPKTPPIHE